MATTHRLGSGAMIYAPGIIAWAINGYHFKDDREALVHVVVSGWQIPEDHAKQLLSGKIPYTVDGDVVVFTVED